MVNLPKQRWQYYHEFEFSKTKKAVLGHMNEIIEACGTFPVVGSNMLLKEIEYY